MIRAIDKIRRGFLWCGRLDLRGGQCRVAWMQVMRPLELGGLRVLNLEVLGWALRIRWLWMQKTQPDRPWALFNLSVLAKVRAMFQISVITTVGDGQNTVF